MTRHMTTAVVAVAVVLTAGAARAQEPVARPGWTFTPSFGFSESYDDNVTLAGQTGFNPPDNTSNNDLISAYTPTADLTFVSRRTRLNAGYGGSLIDYRTFTIFNRWDQHAQVGLHRTETQHLSWGVQGSLTLTPSTDTLDFDGIPFSHTGARAVNARGTVEYKLTQRDSLSTTLQGQQVTFDRPDELRPYLRGGETIESHTVYRRRVNARLGAGGSYSLRLASSVDAPGRLPFHSTRASVDYQMSPSWTLSGGFGFDYIPATMLTPAQSAPGYSASAAWSVRSQRFSVGYQRMFMPSFGYGVAVQMQEMAASYYTPLLRSRRLYTTHSFSLRDNDPLIEAAGGLLRLRTMRFNSRIGWAPQPWVRVEGFYSRAQQRTFLVGGDISRNRLGVQIITSRPVRMQ